MAKRGVGLRGRTVIGLLLAGFVVITLAIVWRRTIGIAESRSVRDLDAQKVQLEGERARLEGEIRDLSTRQHLGPVVEKRLGMHVPTDKQVIILPRSP